MDFVEYNPRDILVPDVRVTSEFDPEIYEQFKASIKADPGAVFIICTLIDGKPWLVDGAHRLVEAIDNNWPKIKVLLVEGDRVDVLTRNLKLDHLRGRHPVSEMLKVMKVLTDEEHLTVEEIVKRTGLKQRYVENLILVNQLTPYCQKSLDEERIKIGHAIELTRIKDPIRQDAVCATLEMYHWDVKTFHDQVTDVLNIMKAQLETPAPLQPRPQIKIKCTYCEELHDVSELANPTTCRECSLAMFQAIRIAREQLAAEAKAAKTKAENEKTASAEKP